MNTLCTLYTLFPILSVKNKVIQITISSPEARNIIPVGGTVEDIPEMEIIKPIILRVLVCSTIIILATMLARYIK